VKCVSSEAVQQTKPSEIREGHILQRPAYTLFPDRSQRAFIDNIIYGSFGLGELIFSNNL
jgi:hypothetical protein